MSGCCEQFTCNIQRPASSLCKALLKTTCHVQKGIHLGGLKHELKGLYKDVNLREHNAYLALRTTVTMEKQLQLHAVKNLELFLQFPIDITYMLQPEI